jgi:hypothetical protein
MLLKKGQFYPSFMAEGLNKLAGRIFLSRAIKRHSNKAIIKDYQKKQQRGSRAAFGRVAVYPLVAIRD